MNPESYYRIDQLTLQRPEVPITRLPETMVLTKDDVLGLFETALTTARREQAEKEAEKQIAEQHQQEQKNAKTLRQFETEIEDAQAVLTRYRVHTRALLTLTSVGVSAGLGGALMIDTVFTSLGWVLLLSGILATLIFGGNAGIEIFDAHRDNKGVSKHPADKLKKIERKKVDWLNE